jgi:hypothetical protein
LGAEVTAGDPRAMALELLDSLAQYLFVGVYPRHNNVLSLAFSRLLHQIRSSIGSILMADLEVVIAVLHIKGWFAFENVVIDQVP